MVCVANLTRGEWTMPCEKNLYASLGTGATLAVLTMSLSVPSIAQQQGGLLNAMRLGAPAHGWAEIRREPWEATAWTERRCIWREPIPLLPTSGHSNLIPVIQKEDPR